METENYSDEEKERKKKHKRSKQRDEERSSKSRRKEEDEGEETKEERRERRRREKENKKIEENAVGDDGGEDERRRRKRKEKDRMKREEVTNNDDNEEEDDDDNKPNKETTKTSRRGSRQKNEDQEDGKERQGDAKDVSRKKERAKKSESDDEEEFEKIIKPSYKAKITKESEIIEQKPFVNLWEFAIKKMEEKENRVDPEAREKSVLFVGSKSAGKSTVILRYLDRSDEVPKPTVALEYIYAKKSKGNTFDKDTGHIWELGGGVWLSSLIESVLDEDNLWTTRLALVLDLSQPKIMWSTLEKWLEVIRRRVDDVIRKKLADDKNFKEKLSLAAKQRIREDHPDMEMMDLMLIPMVIIGTKYDIFQNFESEERKVVSKTLRFIAHRIGAHLQFFSSMKHEGLVSRTKSIISNFLFDTQLSPSNQTAHNKPLSILAGHDSFQEIGLPTIADGDTGRLNARTPMELWKYFFTKRFPQEEASNSSLDKDPTKDPQFNEAAIDSLRAQKDAEFSRFIKSLGKRENIALESNF